MKIPIKWNDSSFMWAGSEDFNWSDAYRIINDVMEALGDWYTPRKWKDVEKKLNPELAKNFLEIVVKVNGLSKTIRKQKAEKTNISVNHIQKTFDKFANDSKKVKVEIEKL